MLHWNTKTLGIYRTDSCNWARNIWHSEFTWFLLYLEDWTCLDSSWIVDVFWTSLEKVEATHSKNWGVWYSYRPFLRMGCAACLVFSVRIGTEIWFVRRETADKGELYFRKLEFRILTILYKRHMWILSRNGHLKRGILRNNDCSL